jgi:hypothetical protein
MNIKTVVKRATAIFEPQKKVEHANDSGSVVAGLTTAGSAPQIAEAVPNTVEQPVVRAKPDLSGLLKPGPKKVAVIAAPPVDAVPAPAPAPTLVAAAAPVVAPPQPVERPTVETPVFSKAEIETIVRQYRAAHPQFQTAPMPETTAAIPVESVGDGKVPGSDKAIYVPSATMIPPDSNSGLEVLTQEQIEEKLSRDLAAEIERRQGRRAPNPQSAITFSKPTGRDEWTRR